MQCSITGDSVQSIVGLVYPWCCIACCLTPVDRQALFSLCHFLVGVFVSSHGICTFQTHPENAPEPCFRRYAKNLGYFRRDGEQVRYALALPALSGW